MTSMLRGAWLKRTRTTVSWARPRRRRTRKRTRSTTEPARVGPGAPFGSRRRWSHSSVLVGWRAGADSKLVGRYSGRRIASWLDADVASVGVVVASVGDGMAAGVGAAGVGAAGVGAAGVG